MDTLYCTKCGKEKETKHFYKKRDTRTGRSSNCKQCVRTHMREYHQKNKEDRNEKKRKWYQENIDVAKEKSREWKSENPHYAKEYYQKNKEIFLNDQKTWNERNPEWVKCKKEYAVALKDEIIIREKNCQVCNKECKTEGHHHDYTKPLEVIWLCSECYVEVSSKLELAKH